jgi:hypothetical protein
LRTWKNPAPSKSASRITDAHAASDSERSTTGRRRAERGEAADEGADENVGALAAEGSSRVAPARAGARATRPHRRVARAPRRDDAETHVQETARDIRDDSKTIADGRARVCEPKGFGGDDDADVASETYEM